MKISDGKVPDTQLDVLSNCGQDLDMMYTSFLTNRMPEVWMAVSFASLKSLGSWMKDLIER